MSKSFKYDYGETARVVASVPASLKPGSLVAVVGMVKLSEPREIFGKCYPAGSNIYTIEYDDGTSVEISEEYIEPFKG